MKGTELNAMFAFPPNKLGYCGQEDSSEKIKAFVIGDKGLEGEVEEKLRGFEAMHSYLELIAGENNAKEFDYGVGEAYWIGNSLLEKVRKEKWGEMVKEKLEKKYEMPPEPAERYAKLICVDSAPHHSFHVLGLFREFGAISGKTGGGIERADKCRVSWGKVLSGTAKGFVVEHTPIEEDTEKGLFFSNAVGKEIANPLEVDAGEGETLCWHWDTACKRLEEKEARFLEHYTKKNISALNTKQGQ